MFIEKIIKEIKLVFELENKVCDSYIYIYEWVISCKYSKQDKINESGNNIKNNKPKNLEEFSSLFSLYSSAEIKKKVTG